MKEEIKKTAKAHGTVSEELSEKKAKDAEKVSLDLIEELNDVEDVVEEELKQNKIKVIEAKQEKKFSRRGPTDEELLEAWNPKTKLGKEVKAGKVKGIDEILDANKKILEPQIVDKLLSLKSDLISIGQAKGKFGGGKRRAWRQTQRITKEGGVLTFSAMAVVGDENGHVGIGSGRAGETLPARDKATRKAKLNLVKVTRGCAAFNCDCSLKHSVPFNVKGKSGSVTVELMPAPQGTGLVCANELKKILRMAGIQDVYSKTSGKVRTTFNVAKACIKALEETNRK